MNDCAEVDELLRDLVDYKNDYADRSKLLKKCSTSWKLSSSYWIACMTQWMPDRAPQQVRQMIKQIHVQINQQREYGWTYELG